LSNWQVNRETIGQDLATGGSGFAMLATAFGSLSGAPIAGFLYGETESYKNTFYIAGEFIPEICYSKDRNRTSCFPDHCPSELPVSSKFTILKR